MFRIMITLLFVGLAPMPCNAEFRDPTQPAYPLPSVAANAAGSDNALVLSAIWISSQSRRATINGVSAKQGQTIMIEQTPTLNSEPATPAKTATIGDKKNELLDKALEYANEGTSRPTQENILAPLLAAASGSNNVPPLQEQSAINPATGSTQLQANTAPDIALPTDLTSMDGGNAARLPGAVAAMQSPKTTHIPARSTTIKIISIHKNSVTINQNGERKTLQLVQRPYKTQ